MIKNIGVVAIQGGFAEHIEMLEKLGCTCIEIRQRSDLSKHQLDGLILPGGESTVIGKLLHELDLFDKIKEMLDHGLPVLGTCAGMILLAKKIINDDNIYFGSMNITVRRNAYGKQSGSFFTNGDFGSFTDVPMVFIRAPYIEKVSANVEILSEIDHHIVAARQDKMIVTAFHPELTTDTRIHKYFLSLIENQTT